MKTFLLILFIVTFTAVPQANAYQGTVISTTTKVFAVITKNLKAFPEDEIIRLSKLSDEAGGTKKIGNELSKLNLPNEVLEDTFMRIALYQGKITRKEAEGMYSRLGNIPGFRTTLRKIIGNSDAKTTGHLNELRIADTALANGFKVLGIGENFSDGLKKAPTDLDVVIQKGEKIFAIEAKDYASTSKLAMDKYRADLDTLKAYAENNNSVVPVFTITNKPIDPGYLQVLQYEADKRAIQLIIGNPVEQIEQIKLLGEIL